MSQPAGQSASSSPSPLSAALDAYGLTQRVSDGFALIRDAGDEESYPFEANISRWVANALEEPSKSPRCLLELYYWQRFRKNRQGKKQGWQRMDVWSPQSLVSGPSIETCLEIKWGNAETEGKRYEKILRKWAEDIFRLLTCTHSNKPTDCVFVLVVRSAGPGANLTYNFTPPSPNQPVLAKQASGADAVYERLFHAGRAPNAMVGIPKFLEACATHVGARVTTLRPSSPSTTAPQIHAFVVEWTQADTMVRSTLARRLQRLARAINATSKSPSSPTASFRPPPTLASLRDVRDEIHIRNLRTIREAELDFVTPPLPRGRKAASGGVCKNVTVLLGNNGSGKTTVLRAIAMAAMNQVLAMGSGFVPYSLVRRASKEKIDSATTAGRFTLYPPQDGWGDSIDLSFSLTPSGSFADNVSDVRLLVSKSPGVTGRKKLEWLDLVHDNQSPAALVVGYGADRRVDSTSMESLEGRNKRRALRYWRIAGLFEESVPLVPLAA